MCSVQTCSPSADKVLGSYLCEAVKRELRCCERPGQVKRECFCLHGHSSMSDTAVIYCSLLNT